VNLKKEHVNPWKKVKADDDRKVSSNQALYSLAISFYRTLFIMQKLFQKPL